MAAMEPCTSSAMLEEHWSAIESKERGSETLLPRRKARHDLNFANTAAVRRLQGDGKLGAGEIQSRIRAFSR